MKTPLDTFFEALQRTGSMEKATHEMKRVLLKRRLQISSADLKAEDFESLWSLIQKEKVLRKLDKK